MEPIEHPACRRRHRGHPVLMFTALVANRHDVVCSPRSRVRLLRPGVTGGYEEGGPNATTAAAGAASCNGLVVVEMASPCAPHRRRSDAPHACGRCSASIWDSKPVRRADDAHFAARRLQGRVTRRGLLFTPDVAAEEPARVSQAVPRDRCHWDPRSADFGLARRRIRASARNERQGRLAARDRRLHEALGEQVVRGPGPCLVRHHRRSAGGFINEEMARL